MAEAMGLIPKATATTTTDSGIRRNDKQKGKGLRVFGCRAAIKATTGVLRCAQDDDVKQTTTKADSGVRRNDKQLGIGAGLR